MIKFLCDLKNPLSSALVKKLVFRCGFLEKISRFLENFTDFQTLKS